MGITGYYAFLTGLLFFFQKLCNNFSLIIRIISSLLIVSVYFYGVAYRSLWFCESDGYCLIHPFLPCIHRIEQVCSKNGCASGRPKWLNKIAIVTTAYTPCSSLNTQAFVYDFLMRCAEVKCKNFDVEVIFTPESAFPFVLNKDEYMQQISFYTGVDLSLVIGAYHETENEMCNGCYWFENGDLKNFFGKKHAIPYLERAPNSKTFACLEKLLLQNNKRYSVAQSTRQVYEYISGIFMYPLICSEVFCTHLFDDAPDNVVVVVMVHDAWVKWQWWKRTLWLYVFMKAWWQKRAVLYISYHESYFFDGDARIWKL